MNDETQLLQQYVRDRSQAAFRALVDRYVNVVHAAARRQVGDADLARDVTQAVFLILAEKAPEVARAESPRPLIGWLLQVTRYASANAVRARARRARHERRAAEMFSTTTRTTTHDRPNDEWQHLAPLLDEGINRLRANDRDVLLLRFFEQKTAREVGLSLGISEDAAEKRIARAVAKLRDFFQRRGVAVSAVALATTLAAHCAEAAPVGLNAAIAASAASAGAGGTAAAASSAAAGVGSAASATSSSAASLSAGAIAKGTLITMATAKTKTVLTAAVAALLLAGSGTVALKTFVSSPRSRQVTLAAAPAVSAPGADGGASVDAVAGPSVAPVVRFAQGTTVELVAISDAPGEPSRWWAPDGTPVSLPADLPRARFGKVEGQRSYEVILRWSDPSGGVAAPSAGPWAGPGGGLNLLVYLDGAQVQGTANTSMTIGDQVVERYQFTMTNDPATVNVRVSLGAGEWSPEQRYSLAGVGSGAAGTATTPASSPAAVASPAGGAGAGADEPARELILEGVTETPDGWLDVAFRWAPQAQRHRTPLAEKLVLIGRDGVELIPQRFRGLPGGRSVLGFKARREDVVELLYQHRPYEEREIRNVSLKPGRKTAPAVGEVQYRARRRG